MTEIASCFHSHLNSRHGTYLSKSYIKRFFNSLKLSFQFLFVNIDLFHNLIVVAWLTCLITLLIRNKQLTNKFITTIVIKMTKKKNIINDNFLYLSSLGFF